jgi:hypothetical protein
LCPVEGKRHCAAHLWVRAYPPGPGRKQFRSSPPAPPQRCQQSAD